jgi:excisionase family DNA binding protein
MTRLLLTVPEAAEALAISRSKLYELLASGAVDSIRIDGSRRIPLTALEAYISRPPVSIRVSKKAPPWGG